MLVATTITEQLKRSSWSRHVFNEGERLRRERGPGRSGYVRLSLTVPQAMIERSLSAFEKAFQQLAGRAGMKKAAQA